MSNIIRKIKIVKLEAILLNKNKKNNFLLELHGKLHHNIISNSNNCHSKIHILGNRNMVAIHSNNQHCKNPIR